MDMQLDSELIRSERVRRAWSQEHLAHVAGIGLRTVQRVEASGAASYESARSLAAALDLTPEALIPNDRSLEDRGSVAAVPWDANLRRMVVLVICLGATITALMLARTAIAERIRVDVGVEVNGEEPVAEIISTSEGVPVELQVNESVKLAITPTLEGEDSWHELVSRGDGLILLTIKILRRGEDGDYMLVGEPRVIAASGEPGKLRFLTDHDPGNEYRIALVASLE